MKAAFLHSNGIVGETGTFSLEVTPADEPVREGGCVRVVPFKKVANYWVPVQKTHPARENYVSLRTPPGVRCELQVTNNGWDILATITKGELAPGETVTFVFGDTSSGSPGLQLAKMAGRAEFRIHLRANAEAEECEVVAAFFDILPADPSKLLVRTRKQPGRSAVLLKAAAVDAFGNTTLNAPAGLELESVAGLALDRPLQFPESGKALCQAEMRMSDEFPSGRVEVVAEKLGLKAKIDPVSLDQQVFWGDLHCHTRLAQALDTPEFLYDYAKNDAALDFLCHVEHYCATDSNRWIGDEWRRWHTHPADLAAYIRDVWAVQQELVRKHHEPGSFVPLLGFEWASNIYGHMNVIFPGDRGDLVYPRSFWSEADTPQTLYDRLAGVEAVVIPHHPSWPVNKGRGIGGVDWNCYDQRLTRLVEICSKHGVSEYFGCPDAIHKQAREGTVKTALDMGHRLGFIGSTDSHASRPGSYGIPGDLWATWGGVTAVLADELDRESIYDALKNRRCYATTGARIILAFSVNGHPMGSEIEHAGELLIKAGVAGTAGIESVELVRNGEVILRQRPVRHDETADFEYIDRPPPETESHYYLRVMQTDGHQAWASPVWVNSEKHG